MQVQIENFVAARKSRRFFDVYLVVIRDVLLGSPESLKLR